MDSFHHKSTLDDIRTRFDQDVERFSQLETGQQATIDAPLVLDLVAKTAATHIPPQGRILDIGCGAGNFTLRVMQECGPLTCDLVDLSQPMLDRARERALAAGALEVHTTQADMRTLEYAEGSFDAILAGAVLHHLRDDADWEQTFAKLSGWLKPGGRLYVADLVTFDDPAIHSLMWSRYGDYLSGLGGEAYRDKVFAYIEQEDSPRSLAYQLELLRKSGFRAWDILHRNSVFACYFGER